MIHARHWLVYLSETHSRNKVWRYRWHPEVCRYPDSRRLTKFLYQPIRMNWKNEKNHINEPIKITMKKMPRKYLTSWNIDWCPTVRRRASSRSVWPSPHSGLRQCWRRIVPNEILDTTIFVASRAASVWTTTKIAAKGERAYHLTFRVSRYLTQFPLWPVIRKKVRKFKTIEQTMTRKFF